MFDQSELVLEVLREVVKVGVVSSIENKRVRVLFPDRDNLVSSPLLVAQAGSIGSMGHWMPAVGEQVLCLFLPNAIEDGFVVSSFFSDAQPAPDVPDSAVVLAGETVRLGDALADDPVVRKSDMQAFGDDILSRIETLVSELNSHTHTAPSGTTGGPTSPPIDPLQDPAAVTADGSAKVFSS